MIEHYRSEEEDSIKIIVAHYDGSNSAVSYARFTLQHGEDTAQLDEIEVHRSLRRQGIGTNLIREGLQDLTELGAKYIEGFIATEDGAGFEQSTQKGYWKRDIQDRYNR